MCNKILTKKIKLNNLNDVTTNLGPGAGVPLRGAAVLLARLRPLRLAGHVALVVGEYVVAVLRQPHALHLPRFYAAAAAPAALAPVIRRPSG